VHCYGIDGSGDSLVAVGFEIVTKEFEAKNMIIGPGSARAIGVDFESSLPGLYWLNFFGMEYVRFIGQEKFASAPAYLMEAIGDGVLILLHPTPDAWDTVEYGQEEKRLLGHLGTQFFFSRNDPTRLTIAPDFMVPRGK
jgi:hypothetical protein